MCGACTYVYAWLAWKSNSKNWMFETWWSTKWRTRLQKPKWKCYKNSYRNILIIGVNSFFFFFWKLFYSSYFFRISFYSIPFGLSWLNRYVIYGTFWGEKGANLMIKSQCFDMNPLNERICLIQNEKWLPRIDLNSRRKRNICSRAR